MRTALKEYGTQKIKPKDQHRGKVQRTGNFDDNSLGGFASVAEFRQEHTTQSIRIQGDHMQQSIISSSDSVIIYKQIRKGLI